MAKSNKQLDALASAAQGIRKDFVSQDTVKEVPTAAPTESIEGLKRNKPPVRNKRMQILISEELQNRLSALAEKTGVSKNQLVNVAIERLLDNEE